MFKGPSSFIPLVRFEIEKLCANWSGKTGAHLNLEMSDLPEFQEIDVACATLSEISKIPELRNFSGDIASLLNHIYGGLIVPDFDKRHELFETAQGLMKVRPSLSIAVRTTKDELNELNESNQLLSKIERHLCLATIHLEFCLNSWIVMASDISPERIKNNLDLTLRYISTAGNLADAYSVSDCSDFMNLSEASLKSL